MSEIVIVLSPGYAHPDGRFADYGDDGSYVGGQMRMDGAVELLRNCPEDLYLLVVGGCDVDATQALHSRKTRHMSHFIRQALQNEEPVVGRRIHEIISLPCTYHNFVAVLHHLRTGSWLLMPGIVNLHVVTNAYHIPRAKLHAKQAVDDVLGQNREIQATVAFTWHAAESVLKLPPSSVGKENPEAYQERLHREKRGLQALKAGLYDDSCFRKKDMLAPLLIAHGRDLLAEHECTKWDIDEALTS